MIPTRKQAVICHAVHKGNVYKTDYSDPNAFKALIAEVVNSRLVNGEQAKGLLVSRPEAHIAHYC